MKIISTTVLYFIFSLLAYSQSLTINEMMSSNKNYILDEDGVSSDWIEIYNNSDTIINLGDYSLSDKANDLGLWTFPNIDIQPSEFILVFCSNKDRSVPNQELHTNFKIKAEGEDLFLTKSGTIVHSLPKVDIGENISYGAITDGNPSFVAFDISTPKYSNNNSVGLEILSFSKQGGQYNETFDLNITSSNLSSNIYYTTDGTVPNLNSHKYNTTLSLDNSFHSQANISQIKISTDELHIPPTVENVSKSIVIRAVALDSLGNLVSKISTHSYFFNSLGIEHSLPVMSICAEHDDLFDFDNGIFVPGVNWDLNNPDWSGNYYQRGIDWEREIHIEYYENANNEGFRQTAGLRTHGGNGRRFPQKALRIYAREEYYDKEFDYQIFSNKPISKYKRLVLRPFFASWTEAGIEDYITNNLASQLQINSIATKPVVLYLNGEYWGIYFLQERIDENYLEANFSVDKDSLQTSWDGKGNFSGVSNYIEANDLSETQHYNAIKDLIDIDNFIDYQLFGIFIANPDWPANNIKYWRSSTSGSKWQWIFFDGDASLSNIEFDGFEQALSTLPEGERLGTNSRATMLLRKLLENEEFETIFLNRLEFLLNNQLNYSKTFNAHQEALSLINNEIHNQNERFAKPSNYSDWEKDVNHCNDFLALRACEINQLVKNRFRKSLETPNCNIANLVVEDFFVIPNPNHGNFSVQFNSSISIPAQLAITNSLGQLVTIQNEVIVEGNNIITFNNLDLPSGILFVNLITSEKNYGAKMICLQP